MKRRVQSEDIKQIKYWADKGLSIEDIAEITGWSRTTVARARFGEEHFRAECKKKCIAELNRRLVKTVEATESTDIVDAPIEEVDEEQSEEQPVVECVAQTEQYSLEDVVKLLKAQNNLISQLIDLWR